MGALGELLVEKVVHVHSHEHCGAQSWGPAGTAHLCEAGRQMGEQNGFHGALKCGWPQCEGVSQLQVKDPNIWPLAHNLSLAHAIAAGCEAEKRPGSAVCLHVFMLS